MIRSSDVKTIQERGDLDRLGYSVMSSIIESGTIERSLEFENPNNQSIVLKTFIQRMLPSSTFFYLEIFEYTSIEDEWVGKSPTLFANNTDFEMFNDFLEVSSTPSVYTSKEGNIYSITLMLARAGGG